MSIPSTKRLVRARWVVVTLIAVAAVVFAVGPAKSFVFIQHDTHHDIHHDDARSAQVARRTLQPAAAVTPATRARINASFATLPLAFEANEGQTDPQVKYMARGNGYQLYLTSSLAILNVRKTRGMSEVRDMLENKRRGPAKIKQMLEKRALSNARGSSMAALRMNLLGANPHMQLMAEDQQAGRVNYFIGNDPSKWHSNIPLFGRVNYRNIYPGVDLAFHGAAKQLEFDYLVSPGADPGSIALGFQGADKMETTADGDLILSTDAGPIRLHKPFAYQQTKAGRQNVNARFVVKSRNEVAFVLAPYDHTRELVIDPIITYSTYFGGDAADYGTGIAMDNNTGDVLVTGATDSLSIPGNTNGTSGGFDAFVTEVTPAGTLVFTTIFGGSAGDEFPGGIAVDSAGIYVAGTTSSNNFPATVGQTTFLGGTVSGNNDAFAVKLASTGSFAWGTYIAGSESDSGLGVAVDAAHNVYVVGETFSVDLGCPAAATSPCLHNPLPSGSVLNQGSVTTPRSDDGYITKLNPTGTAYTLLSYIGGTSNDLATGVAVDGPGNIWVTGNTISTNLPVTSGVIQPTCGTDSNCNAGASGAQDDAFVAAIPSSLIGYKYFTYYGGSGADDASAIAVDSSGNAFVTGNTSSTNFPTHGTPLQSTLLGAQNAFVLSLNSTATAANYATYLGGSGTEFGDHIALDSAGDAYVTGQTSSSDFPMVSATQLFGGATDAFVSVVVPNGSGLLFSTYLGGSGDENQLFGSVAVDSSSQNNIYVTGDTDSGLGSTTVFPTKSALDSSIGTGGTCHNSSNAVVPCPDAFITGYTPATAADFDVFAAALSPAAVNPGGSSTSTITVTALNSFSHTVNLSCAVTGTGSPAPTCSLSPSSVSGGNGNATLTVTTTGKTGAMFRPSNIFYAMWLPVFGLSLVGVRLGSSRSRGRKMLGFLLFGMVLIALFLLPACGGSSHGGGGGGCTGCTPAGNYTITVTGTDATNSNLTHPANSLTLTVN